ncbi:hypothetical protein HJC23_003229 [Cyclotella cryptica]|uniref:Exostosin GT47 domain-containing protein n=1 Tax=Cyclotella cryptica TaxID=29204 RepID=A0ABD3PE62_9STRA|eukprot:CCRYP_015492-RA/>CCRYP_015492-RA protein AED:0.00 eAED:0.00 QI:39/-1/1/1/-1/1/1/580/571
MELIDRHDQETRRQNNFSLPCCRVGAIRGWHLCRFFCRALVVALVIGDFMIDQRSLLTLSHSTPLAPPKPSIAIDPSDESCPFRNSPLYRSVYIYPTPDFSLNQTRAQLAQQNSIYSPKGGRTNGGVVRPYPWLEWDRRTREEGGGWGHYDVGSPMGQYTLELVVREILRHPNSCLQTDDPQEAKLFYVPYLPSVEFHQGRLYATDYSTSPYGKAIYDALEGNYDAWEDYFGFTSKYWKRRNGSDHILVWSEPLHGYSHPKMKRGNHHFIYTQRLLRPAIGVVVEVSTTFVDMFPKCAAKNILVPYPNPDGKWLNGKFDREAQELGRKINAAVGEMGGELYRPASYYYNAGNHGTCANMRSAMQADYKCTQSYTILNQLAPAKKKLPSNTLGMRLSKICPCPGGDSPSAKRNFDSLLAGCIPLVLSHDFVWPFSREFDPAVNVDPNDFSIRLNAADFEEPHYQENCTPDSRGISRGLPKVIEDIIRNDTELERLQRGVKKAADLYSFYRRTGSEQDMPDNPLREGILPDGGAAHALVDALAARVGGERWVQCEKELARLTRHLPEVKTFKC